MKVKVYVNQGKTLSHIKIRLQGFFQDFLLGPFLQRRLSLAEQLGWLHPLPPPPPPLPGGWHLYSINVVETECVKAGALYKGHYKLVKDGERIVFLVLWDEFQPFFLNCRVSNWKLISTRHEFNSDNFIFTALKLWWEDWVSKLNSRLSFWGRLTALKNPWKKPLDVNKWTSYECWDEGTSVSHILRTFITYLLIRIHQKKKITLGIAAKIAIIRGLSEFLGVGQLPPPCPGPLVCLSLPGCSLVQYAMFEWIYWN
jgi:hypothetical protein